jgi:predicted metalloprotease with PDZ domain
LKSADLFHLSGTAINSRQEFDRIISGCKDRGNRFATVTYLPSEMSSLISQQSDRDEEVTKASFMFEHILLPHSNGPNLQIFLVDLNEKLGMVLTASGVVAHVISNGQAQQAGIPEGVSITSIGGRIYNRMCLNRLKTNLRLCRQDSR